MRSISCALFLASYVAAATQRGTTAVVPVVTATTSVVSDYVYRGERLGGLSLQPGLDWRAGEWSAGLSANIPLGDKVTNQADPEIDFSATRRFAVGR